MQRLIDWLTAPSGFDPLVFIVLVALTVLITLGSIVWLVLVPEEPATPRGASGDPAADASSALARMAARSEQEAARVRRELDVDAGRGSSASVGGRR